MEISFDFSTEQNTTATVINFGGRGHSKTFQLNKMINSCNLGGIASVVFVPCKPAKRKRLLTRSQRHTAYILMLAEAESKKRLRDYFGSSTDGGFCFMWEVVTGSRYDLGFGRLLYNSFKETLPELYAKKPLNDKAFWFPCGQWKERIELLKQCIEETA